MEVATKLGSSPSYPFRTHLKKFPPPHLPSALKLCENSALVPTSMITVSLPQHFRTSVLIQEQCYDNKSVLQIMEEKTSQATLDKRVETEPSGNEDLDGDQYLKEFQSQFLRLPGLRSGSLFVGEDLSLSLAMQSVFAEPKKLMDFEIQNVVDLARKALSASREAAILTTDCKNFVSNHDESVSQSSVSMCFSERPVKTVKSVRSTRLLERESKRRKMPSSVVTTPETSMSKTVRPKRITNKNVYSNDILRHFMAPEATQLLTAKEESELIVQIKDLRCLENIKSRLQVEFGRDPTMVEWAEAVGVNFNALQSRINSGKRSGEKLVYANIRLAAYMAKQYQGNGLSLQDLVQEGSVGLLMSVVKYNPRSGCRFSTYAYWWIKQAIKMAIYQKSRTDRLPVSVYTLMYKVSDAKRLCAQEGNHEPTIEQIAMRAGISVEKLQKLQVAVRKPLSMQQCVWTDQATTFQEITSDPVIESPKRAVEKKYMRNHIRNLVQVLPPIERKIITMRYGIGGGYRETLAGIGAVVGLSDERVRRFEMQGMNRLKELMSSQGLGAYADLLFTQSP